MKKTLVVMIAVIMLFAFAACAPKTVEPEAAEPEATEPEAAEDAPEEIAGGFTVNTEFPECNAPKEALDAFEAAQEGYTGVGLEPVALLGTQVVAGTNYAFLCRATLVTANPVTDLKVAIIYQDLDGKAEITNVSDVDVATVCGDSMVEFDESLAGGWTTFEADAAKLPDEVQKAFDKALEGYTGVGLTPVALMGSQVVAGTNYAILCRANSVTPDGGCGLCAIVVYADLQDGAELLSMNNFSIADYNA